MIFMNEWTTEKNNVGDTVYRFWVDSKIHWTFIVGESGLGISAGGKIYALAWFDTPKTIALRFNSREEAIKAIEEAYS